MSEPSLDGERVVWIIEFEFWRCDAPLLSHFENSQEQKINTEDGVDPTPARMGCQHFWRHQCSREFVLSVIFLSLFIVAARRSAFITAGVSGRRFNANEVKLGIWRD